MLMNGLNFINVLHTAFALVDPKSVKDTDDLTIIFTLLGSTGAKAVHRILMKLTPDCSNQFLYKEKDDQGG